MAHNRNARRGLTLLELLLALGLSALVLLAVGMAIDLHFRMFDVRRTNVEEVQLARSLLRHMADDLRSAVQSMPVDLSGLEEVTSNTATAAGALASGLSGDNEGDDSSGGQSGGGQSGSGQSGGSSQGGSQNNPMQPGGASSKGGATGGSGASGGSSGGGSGTGSGGDSGGSSDSGSQADSVPTTGTAEESAVEAPVLVVGLYGSATQMQFDVSRLPRVDQYQAILSPDSQLGVVDIPSDIKTITYFLRSEESAATSDVPISMAAAPQPSTTGRGRGLMRRELDRAVSIWAEQNGNVSDTFADAKLLAPEVTSLQLQYFDGTQWLAEWNSDTAGGLPLAVEIILTIQSAASDPEGTEVAPLLSTTGYALPGETVYRQVVHLPIARPAAPTSTETTDTTDTTAAAGESAEAVP